MNRNINSREFIFKSLMAGVCIAIAGFAYIKVGGVIGATLFAFGLISVISFKFNLFTGKANEVWRTGKMWLLGMLLLNIAGCAFIGSMANLEMSLKAQEIMAGHLKYGPLQSLLSSVLCGVIMTMSVKGNLANVVFGVIVFIACGFPHCIADAFYLACCGKEYLLNHIGHLSWFYSVVVIGNFLGCNIFRIIDEKKD